mgnify:CR=1 FL=1|tara:strand:+ start:1649 stop:2500 length:852 start_codon:yes stop_codon:yes gene_type:complete
MASLIKTNKVSTPGGQEFTLPTTYPSSTVDLTSTSGGQLGYGSANPVTDRMQTSSSTSVTGDVFCDKARVNNASSVVSSVILNTVPSGTTDLDEVSRTRFHFSGACFTGVAKPCMQLLNASNANCLTGNYTASQRLMYSYGGGNSQQNASRSMSVTEKNQGHMLYHPSLTQPTGASQSGEIFTKTSATNGLAMLGGELVVSQYNKAHGYPQDHFLIESVFIYNNNASFSTTNSVNFVMNSSFWVYPSGENAPGPYTQLKFYDANGNNVNEGMFMTYSNLNANK